MTAAKPHLPLSTNTPFYTPVRMFSHKKQTLMPDTKKTQHSVPIFRQEL